MDSETVSIINAALTTSPLLGVAFVLWKSGLLDALVKRLTDKSAPDGNVGTRVHALEEFQMKAETNHFHDLANVMEDIREIKGHIAELRTDHRDTRERLIHVEAETKRYGKK